MGKAIAADQFLTPSSSFAPMCDPTTPSGRPLIALALDEVGGNGAAEADASWFMGSSLLDTVHVRYSFESTFGRLANTGVSFVRAEAPAKGMSSPCRAPIFHVMA